VRRTNLILGAAAFAYFVTVLERSSMGVASLAASSRFGVGAAALSSLAVAQLAVYAAMQMPTGLLLDRYGARRLIIIGSLLTGMGNFIVAVSGALAYAVAGRMVVGLGDALIFVSMIRLINGWVQGPRATRLTQLFANIGQLGQIASAIPFAYILGVAGWTAAFGLISGAALLAAGMALVFIKDESSFENATVKKRFRAQLIENLKDPLTRKAFWVHFTMQSSGSAFILLWGYPFLVQAEGLPKSLASALLSSFVFIGFIVGPILSGLCVRFPAKRHLIVIYMYALIAGSWVLVIASPGKSPLWELIMLVLVIGAGGPASMIAFDYSRVGVPKHRLGSTNGVINSGAFVAAFTIMFLIGLALDFVKATSLFGASALYSLDGFKFAFCAPLVVLTSGLVMFLIERRRLQSRQE
jgi:MFS family permease